MKIGLSTSCLDIMSNIKKIEIDLQTNVVIRETYLANGRIHRDPNEGPAEIGRDRETGEILWELYKWKGQKHREHGPAEIDRDNLGRVIKEIYWLRNAKHRNPKLGPAERSIKYLDEIPFVTEEAHFVNNICYRDPEDGPCNILRDPNSRQEIKSFSDPREMPSRPVPGRLSGRNTKSFGNS